VNSVRSRVGRHAKLASAVGLGVLVLTLLAACDTSDGKTGAGDVRVTAWQLTSVSDGGRDLAVSFVAGGGCHADAQIDSAESATSVTITATTRKTSSASACTQNVVVGRTTVHLRRPDGVAGDADDAAILAEEIKRLDGFFREADDPAGRELAHACHYHRRHCLIYPHHPFS